MRKFDDFDHYAEDYRETHDKAVQSTGGNSEYFSRYKIAQLAKEEDINSKLKILDFGCGDGYSCKYLRTYFPNATIHGIDPSAESIEIARKRNIPACTFSDFDGLEFPRSIKEYDVVFTSMVFHHIAPELHKQILEKIHQVLTSTGRFYIFEHNPKNPLTRKIVRDCPFDEDAILLQPEYARNVLHSTAFEIIHLKFLLFFPRHRIFSPFHALESYMTWIPFGAQYYIKAIKAIK